MVFMGMGDSYKWSTRVQEEEKRKKAFKDPMWSEPQFQPPAPPRPSSLMAPPTAPSPSGGLPSYEPPEPRRASSFGTTQFEYEPYDVPAAPSTTFPEQRSQGIDLPRQDALYDPLVPETWHYAPEKERAAVGVLSQYLWDSSGQNQLPFDPEKKQEFDEFAAQQLIPVTNLVVEYRNFKQGGLFSPQGEGEAKEYMWDAETGDYVRRPDARPVVRSLYGAEEEILEDPSGAPVTLQEIGEALEWAKKLSEESERQGSIDAALKRREEDKKERERVEDERPYYYSELSPEAQKEIDDEIAEKGELSRGGVSGALRSAITEPASEAVGAAGRGAMAGLEKYEEYIQRPAQIGMAATGIGLVDLGTAAMEFVSGKDFSNRGDDLDFWDIFSSEGREELHKEFQDTVQFYREQPGPVGFVASTMLLASADPATYVPTGSGPFGDFIMARVAKMGAPAAAQTAAKVSARALYELADNGGPLMSIGIYGGAEGVQRGYWLDPENEWSMLAAGLAGGVAGAVLPKAAYRVAATGYNVGASALYKAATTNEERLFHSYRDVIEQNRNLDFSKLPDGTDAEAITLHTGAAEILAMSPMYEALELKYRKVPISQRIDNLLGRPALALAMANDAMVRQPALAISALTDAVANGRIRPYDAAHSLALAGFMATGNAAKHLWGAAEVLAKDLPGLVAGSPVARALGATAATGAALVATDDFGQDLSASERAALILAPSMLGMVRSSYSKENWYKTGEGDPVVKEMPLPRALQEPNWVDRISNAQLGEILGREIDINDRPQALVDLIGARTVGEYERVVSQAGTEFIGLSRREISNILDNSGHYLSRDTTDDKLKAYYLAISTPEAQFDAAYKGDLPTADTMRADVRAYFGLETVPDKHLKQLWAMIDADDAYIRGGNKLQFDDEWRESGDFWWVPDRDEITTPAYELFYNGAPGTKARHELANRLESGKVGKQLDPEARDELVQSLRDTSRTDYQYFGGAGKYGRDPKPAPHVRTDDFPEGLREEPVTATKADEGAWGDWEPKETAQEVADEVLGTPNPETVYLWHGRSADGAPFEVHTGSVADGDTLFLSIDPAISSHYADFGRGGAEGTLYRVEVKWDDLIESKEGLFGSEVGSYKLGEGKTPIAVEEVPTSVAVKATELRRAEGIDRLSTLTSAREIIEDSIVERKTGTPADSVSRREYEADTSDAPVKAEETPEARPQEDIRKAEIQRTLEVVSSFSEKTPIAIREGGKWIVLDTNYGKMRQIDSLPPDDVARLARKLDDFKRAVMDPDETDWWSTLPEQERAIRIAESFGEFFTKPDGWENAKPREFELPPEQEEFARLMRKSDLGARTLAEGADTEFTPVHEAYVARRVYEAMGGNPEDFSPLHIQRIFGTDADESMRIWDGLKGQDELVTGELQTQTPRGDFESTRRPPSEGKSGVFTRKERTPGKASEKMQAARDAELAEVTPVPERPKPSAAFRKAKEKASKRANKDIRSAQETEAAAREIALKDMEKTSLPELEMQTQASIREKLDAVADKTFKEIVNDFPEHGPARPMGDLVDGPSDIQTPAPKKPKRKPKATKPKKKTKQKVREQAGLPEEAAPPKVEEPAVKDDDDWFVELDLDDVEGSIAKVSEKIEEFKTDMSADSPVTHTPDWVRDTRNQTLVALGAADGLAKIGDAIDKFSKTPMGTVARVTIPGALGLMAFQNEDDEDWGAFYRGAGYALMGLAFANTAQAAHTGWRDRGLKAEWWNGVADEVIHMPGHREPFRISLHTIDPTTKNIAAEIEKQWNDYVTQIRAGLDILGTPAQKAEFERHIAKVLHDDLAAIKRVAPRIMRERQRIARHQVLDTTTHGPLTSVANFFNPMRKADPTTRDEFAKVFGNMATEKEAVIIMGEDYKLIKRFEEAKEKHGDLIWDQLVRSMDNPNYSRNFHGVNAEDLKVLHDLLADSSLYLRRLANYGVGGGIFQPEILNAGGYFPRARVGGELATGNFINPGMSSGRSPEFDIQFWERARESTLMGEQGRGNLLTETNPGQTMQAYAAELVERVHGERLKSLITSLMDDGAFINEQMFESLLRAQGTPEQQAWLRNGYRKVTHEEMPYLAGNRVTLETVDAVNSIKHRYKQVLSDMRRVQRAALLSRVSVKSKKARDAIGRLLDHEVAFMELTGKVLDDQPITLDGGTPKSYRQAVWTQFEEHLDWASANFQRSNARGTDIKQKMADEYDGLKARIEAYKTDPNVTRAEHAQLAQDVTDYYETILALRSGSDSGMSALDEIVLSQLSKADRNKLAIARKEMHGELEGLSVPDMVARGSDSLQVELTQEALETAVTNTQRAIDRIASKLDTDVFQEKADLLSQLDVAQERLNSINADKKPVFDRLRQETSPLYVRTDAIPVVNQFAPLLDGGASSRAYNVARSIMRTVLSGPIDLYMIGNTGKTALSMEFAALLNKVPETITGGRVQFGAVNMSRHYKGGTTLKSLGFQRVLTTAKNISNILSPEARHAAEFEHANMWSGTALRAHRAQGGVGGVVESAEITMDSAGFSPVNQTLGGFTADMIAKVSAAMRSDPEASRLSPYNAMAGLLDKIEVVPRTYETMVTGSERLQFNGWVRTIKLHTIEDAARQYMTKNGGKLFNESEYGAFRMFDFDQKKFEMITKLGADPSTPKDAFDAEAAALLRKWQQQGLDIADPEAYWKKVGEHKKNYYLDLENEAFRYSSKLADGLYGGKNLRSTGLDPKLLRINGILFGAPNWFYSRAEIFADALNPFHWKNSPGKQWAAAQLMWTMPMIGTLVAMSMALDDGFDLDNFDEDDFWRRVKNSISPINDDGKPNIYFMDVKMPDGSWISPFTWEKDVVRSVVIAYGLMNGDEEEAMTSLSLLGQARLGGAPRMLLDMVSNRNFAQREISDKDLAWRWSDLPVEFNAREIIRGNKPEMEFSKGYWYQEMLNTLMPAMMNEIFKGIPQGFDEFSSEAPFTPWESVGEALGQGSLSPLGVFMNIVGSGRARTATTSQRYVELVNEGANGGWPSSDGITPSAEPLQFDSYGDLSRGQKNWLKEQYPELEEYVLDSLPDAVREAQDTVEKLVTERGRAFRTSGLMETEDGGMETVTLEDVKSLDRQLTETVLVPIYDTYFSDVKDPKNPNDKLAHDYYENVYEAAVEDEQFIYERYQVLDEQWRLTHSAADYAYIQQLRQWEDDPTLSALNRAKVAANYMGAFRIQKYRMVPMEDTTRMERLVDFLRHDFSEHYGADRTQDWESLMYWFVRNADDNPRFAQVYGVDDWGEVDDWGLFTNQVEAVVRRQYAGGYERARQQYPGLYMWMSDDDQTWKTLEQYTDDLPETLRDYIIDGGEMPNWDELQIGKPLEFAD
jgi:hypothetical protein